MSIEGTAFNGAQVETIDLMTLTDGSSAACVLLHRLNRAIKHTLSSILIAYLLPEHGRAIYIMTTAHYVSLNAPT